MKSENVIIEYPQTAEKDDKIACVKASTLYPYNQQSSFYEWAPTLYSRILTRREFRKRDDLENDETYRQIIPYLIIKNVHTNKILCYQRQGSEDRLFGQWSIGFGGHWREGEEILQCIFRELNEETTISSYLDISPIGFVCSNIELVDLVHFGIVHIVEVDYRVDIRKEANESLWLSLDSAEKYRLENWSRLIAGAFASVGDITTEKE